MARVTGVPTQVEERHSYLPLVESLRSCTIQQVQGSPPAGIADDVVYVGVNEYAELEACRYPCESSGGARSSGDNSEDSDDHSSRSSSDSEGSIVGLNGDPATLPPALGEVYARRRCVLPGGR